MILFTLALLAQHPGDSVVYELAPASRLEVTTGKSGLLGFAGHEHTVRATKFSGRILRYPNDPARSHVAITISTLGLEVLTPPDTAEIRKVTASMREDVLDVARYPEIALVSRSVSGAGDTLHLIADLTIKGQTREIAPIVILSTHGDTLHATTRFTIKQTDFGIRPYRGGPGGTVRVANEVRFTIDAVALAVAQP